MKARREQIEANERNAVAEWGSEHDDANIDDDDDGDNMDDGFMFDEHQTNASHEEEVSHQAAVLPTLPLTARSNISVDVIETTIGYTPRISNGGGDEDEEEGGGYVVVEEAESDSD
jgi:hypothetical protein